MLIDRPNRSFVAVILMSLLAGFLLLGAMVFSVAGIWEFWTTASVTCVECIKSFAKTFFDPRQVVLCVLFVWSTYRFTKVLRFVFREWSFARMIDQMEPSDRGVYLLASSAHAAWSAGIFSRAICANAQFWETLSSDERSALVAHESWHLKQGDAWFFFALGFIQEVFADPVSRRILATAVKRLQLEREVRADQAAIHATSQGVLGSLLLKALLFEGQSPVAAPGLETVIHERVRLLRGEGADRSVVGWGAFAPAMMIGVLGMSLPVLFPPMVQCLFT